ncbi:Sterile alpha motif/pointed domain [Pseudocohnilembus persalinus]|uniref:Sterile alpha motif/pointed domain n=1 Tax=Pseudocohnilembus persalinus TaxID=266149 RepID=A0A0V0R1C4_PSEPJ|nr:Sterile alpha motif/pointed domain [Pseudocohnilembus persalinus]|eukprot:KRX08283.1 Sterile alpha motif/pointed domain [Pseudocohnilembus persalinus]
MDVKTLKKPRKRVQRKDLISKKSICIQGEWKQKFQDLEINISDLQELKNNVKKTIQEIKQNKITETQQTDKENIDPNQNIKFPNEKQQIQQKQQNFGQYNNFLQKKSSEQERNAEILIQTESSTQSYSDKYEIKDTQVYQSEQKQDNQTNLDCIKKQNSQQKDMKSRSCILQHINKQQNNGFEQTIQDLPKEYLNIFLDSSIVHVQTIGSWLRQLQLEEYLQNFIDNSIYENKTLIDYMNKSQDWHKVLISLFGIDKHGHRIRLIMKILQGYNSLEWIVYQQKQFQSFSNINYIMQYVGIQDEQPSQIISQVILQLSESITTLTDSIQFRDLYEQLWIQFEEILLQRPIEYHKIYSFIAQVNSKQIQDDYIQNPVSDNLQVNKIKKLQKPQHVRNKSQNYADLQSQDNDFLNQMATNQLIFGIAVQYFLLSFQQFQSKENLQNPQNIEQIYQDLVNQKYMDLNLEYLGLNQQQNNRLTYILTECFKQYFQKSFNIEPQILDFIQNTSQFLPDLVYLLFSIVEQFLQCQDLKQKQRDLIFLLNFRNDLLENNINENENFGFSQITEFLRILNQSLYRKVCIFNRKKNGHNFQLEQYYIPKFKNDHSDKNINILFFEECEKYYIVLKQHQNYNFKTHLIQNNRLVKNIVNPNGEDWNRKQLLENIMDLKKTLNINNQNIQLITNKLSKELSIANKGKENQYCYSNIKNIQNKQGIQVLNQNATLNPQQQNKQMGSYRQNYQQQVL